MPMTSTATVCRIFMPRPTQGETDTLFLNLGERSIPGRHARKRAQVRPGWYGNIASGPASSIADAQRVSRCFVANGHVDSGVDKLGDPNNTFRQRAQFYRNAGRVQIPRYLPLRRAVFPTGEGRPRSRAMRLSDNDGRMDLAVASQRRADCAVAQPLGHAQSLGPDRIEGDQKQPRRHRDEGHSPSVRRPANRPTQKGRRGFTFRPAIPACSSGSGRQRAWMASKSFGPRDSRNVSARSIRAEAT